MLAVEVWGSNLNGQLTQTNTVVEVIKSHDYGRIGIFAVINYKFNIFTSKVVKFYYIEVFEYNSDGYPEAIDYIGCKNKADLIKTFKTYQLK